MRCPKCHYISFDSGDRCRNCGYDFSLTVDVRDPDLPIHTGDEPLGPMTDLRLDDPDGPAARPPRQKVWEPAPEPEADGDPAQLPVRAAQPRRPAASSPLDLPLFTGPRDDDTPLVAPQAVPRAPLAVRRAAAPAIKPKSPAEPSAEPVLDLGIPEAIAPVPAAQYAPEELRPAPMTRRFIAGAIDVSILGSIDAAVLYFTLGLCGLRLVEATLIPVVPFGAFLLLLNGGYVVGFTAAAGQTVGKMATGIRVVPAFGERPERVPFGFAVVRAAAYLVSVLPAGLGFIPAVLGPDHRAVHDRLADTRVVRA
jgi:uncharacterized RDD family membrane protein YckC